jgi:hypothetical protein
MNININTEKKNLPAKKNHLKQFLFVNPQVVHAHSYTVSPYIYKYTCIYWETHVSWPNTHTCSPLNALYQTAVLQTSDVKANQLLALNAHPYTVPIVYQWMAEHGLCFHPRNALSPVNFAVLLTFSVAQGEWYSSGTSWALQWSSCLIKNWWKLEDDDTSPVRHFF